MSTFSEQLSLILGARVDKDNLDLVVNSLDVMGKVDSKIMLKLILLICKHIMQEE